MVFWNEYDIANAIIGGLLIGAATTFHFLFKGRITGFSGIYYSLVTMEQQSFLWKLTLMASIVVVSCGLFKAYGFWDSIIFSGATPVFDNAAVMLKHDGVFGFSIAGFLVGLGTKLSNGCTSGHGKMNFKTKQLIGVCGLPRFSNRSIVATCCFMFTGFATASIKQFAKTDEEINADRDFIAKNYNEISTVWLSISLTVVVMCTIFQYMTKKEGLVDIFIATITGAVFGLGLVISGMNRRSKILGFLTINEDWDPSLGFVMAGAVGLNVVTFNLIIYKLKKPFLGAKLEIPTNKVIDFKLVLGASIFGIGWGVGGLCPGPAFTLTPMFSFEIQILFLLFLAFGQYTAAYLDKKYFSGNNTNNTQSAASKIKNQVQPDADQKQEEQHLRGNENIQINDAQSKGSPVNDNQTHPEQVPNPLPA